MTSGFFGGGEATDIAWYYPEPKEKAAEIKNFVAFYVGKVEGLTVEEFKE